MKKYILVALLLIILLSSFSLSVGYYIYVFSLSCWLMIPFKRSWSRISVGILLFSLCYYCILLILGEENSLLYLIAPVVFYRLGEWIMSQFRDENSRQLLLLIIFLAYLYPLFSLTIQDVMYIGLVNTSRVMTNSGTHNYLAATLYGMVASVGVGCFASIFLVEQKHVIRFGFIILAILALFVSVHLVNRTGVVIALFCLFISFLLTLKKNVKVVFYSLLIIGLLSFLLVKIGVIDESILLAYENRELHELDASSAGGRTGLWARAVTKLLVSPFGWSNANDWKISYYAHNLWLDIARLTGWIPFGAFLYASFLYFKQLFKLLLHWKYPSHLLLISVNVSILLAAAVEPAIEGSSLFFFFMMLVWGITSKVSKENELLLNFKY